MASINAEDEDRRVTAAEELLPGLDSKHQRS